MDERIILHCDCNSFFASVECVLRPELKTVPMAVCGDPENRHGIILAKNELAKSYGIRTAETIWEAKRKCPALVLVLPHHDRYQKYSHIVNEIYERFTDLVEPFGIDESWLDVTGSTHLFGDGKTIADTLRETVHAETGLTISVGVSFNKVFAKLGSDYKKPDATTVISRENFRDLVHPLPVGDLLYVGKAARTALDRLYIHTIGELAESDRAVIARRLGKLGEMIHDYACGLDNSPVRPADEAREVKSVGNGMTFKRNLQGISDIRLGVLTLADQVAARLRRHGLEGQTVQVSIRDPNFKTITRQKALGAPTNLAKELADASLELIAASWQENAPIRMLTITATGLVPTGCGVEQLSLFDGEKRAAAHARQEKLEAAMDSIRGKFGHGAIGIANVIGNDLGIAEEDSDDGGSELPG